MAFSGSSYFAGVGTAFVAVAIGFAGGALVTTSAVQPPNRLERVTSSAPLGAPAPSSAMTEQPNAASAPGSARSEAPATPAAPSQKAESQTAQQPAPAEPAAVKTDTARSDTATNNDAPSSNAQRAPTVGSSARNQPAPSAMSEDATLPKNERTGTRSNDWRKEAYRKQDRKAEDRKLDDRQADDRRTDERRADDRRFMDRSRRQDLDEATNTGRQMRRDNPSGQVVVEREGPPRYVERDGPPRYVEERAPRSRFFESDEDAPRSRGEGPRPFGFFGNN